MKLILLGLSLVLLVSSVPAQQPNQNAQALAEHSAIVVAGRVLKIDASDEPLVAPSARTAIVSVQRIYAGAELAGDQKGRTVTVILSNPEAVKVGEEALFFGNPRFLGKSLTIADEGELPMQEAAASTQAAIESGALSRRDAPILDRLSAASLVFRGSVESIRPLEPLAEGKRAAPTSEHDPEWQAATVRIVTPLRDGQAGQVVTVVFAASRDITWFNSPKLRAGQDAVFIARTPTKQESARHRGLAGLMEKQPVYLVTEPFDVLPATDEPRVRGLLTTMKETKQ